MLRQATGRNKPLHGMAQVDMAQEDMTLTGFTADQVAAGLAQQTFHGSKHIQNERVATRDNLCVRPTNVVMAAW